MYKQEFKGLNISGNQHFSAFKVSYYRRNAHTHIRTSFGRVWSARFYISYITACRESASFLDSLWSKKQLKVYRFPLCDIVDVSQTIHWFLP